MQEGSYGRMMLCKIRYSSSVLWPLAPAPYLVLQPPHVVAERLVFRKDAITMAWIPMRTDLAGDPAVLGMANALAIDTDTVVGKLHRFWSWADAQSRDGHASVTPTDVNCVVACDGFAQALESVGWLTIKKDGVTIPNWDHHLSRSAKKRAGGARRQQRRRQGGNASVTKASHNDVTKALPHNSTVQNKKKSLSTKTSPAKRRTRKPDPIWDTLAELFFPSGVSKTDATRMGKLVRDLKAKSATPDTIREHVRTYKREWPTAACTPEAVVKHWDQFAKRAHNPFLDGPQDESGLV